VTYIIAEIGINHNGSLDLAKKLIDAARWCGADAVKFQKRTVDLVFAGQLDKPRESPWGLTLGEQKYGLEFDRDEYNEIDSYCKQQKMPWFASAWDIPSLEFLKAYDLPFNKVASAMATNGEFLQAVKWDGRRAILSTGLCNELQMSQAINALGDSLYAVLHCVGAYPAKEEDLNLNYITKLRKNFKKNGMSIKVGYSGHETSVSPSVVAVVLGAKIIERHITLDRSMYGSDQAASLEPVGFQTMVQQIRKIPAILGDGIKTVTKGEEEVARKLRYWMAA
jgi:N-acetylneuraminate synthase